MPSSSKSYDYGREHETELQTMEFIPSYQEIEVDEYDGDIEVQMHDGSWIILSKVEHDFDPTDRMAAYRLLEESNSEGRFLTGLFYIDTSRPDLNSILDTVDTPLASLPAEKLRPSRESLEKIMDAL